MANGNKSSADVEREVNAQRDRVEQRMVEIRDRLSPGQLIDTALSYTRDGGAQFAGNLGRQITANPLPVALLGISVAWLISSNMAGERTHEAHLPALRTPEPDYPYARVKGGLKRVSHKADEAGQWWSEFETEAGERYKAKSNRLGERAGHFTDQAGKTFSGFIDDAGNRVKAFQDEAGNRLEEATGWAAHGWQQTQHGVRAGLHGMGSAAHQAGTTAQRIMDSGRDMGGMAQKQADHLASAVSDLFERQPLIAGALAFAAGAAMGAVLPHTNEEDQLLGRSSDRVRKEAGKAAGKLYEEGKERAEDLYDDATDRAAHLYDEARDKVAGLASDGSPGASVSRH